MMGSSTPMNLRKSGRIKGCSIPEILDRAKYLLEVNSDTPKKRRHDRG
jgi:hypothetical protein